MPATSGKPDPNVLIFMTDQQNAGTIFDGAAARAKTPCLDLFAAEGIAYSAAFTTAPHCSPSRASFFSGKYPSEHGVWNNVNVSNALSRGPRPGTPFWSEEFRHAGYRLGFSGKWHVSNWQTPSDFGWEELLVFPETPARGIPLHEQRAHARLRELAELKRQHVSEKDERIPGEIVRPGWPRYVHYGTDEDPFRDSDVVDRGIDFIKSGDREIPWLLYTGTLGPHDPYTPPRRYLDMYDAAEVRLPESFWDDMHDKPALYRRTRARFDQLTEAEHKEALRHYLAFCTYQDALFGRLLDALDESDQRDNTIVIYLSDHGDYAGEHGLWGKGLPAFQSAYRIPLVLCSPRLDLALRGTVDRTPLTIADIGEMLLKHTAVKLPSRTSGAVSSPSDDVFFQTNGNESYGIQRTVLSGRWKLVYNMFDFDEMYDLASDPSEQQNLLYSETPRKLGVPALVEIPEWLRPIVTDMYRRLWQFAVDHDDNLFDSYILTAMASIGPSF